MEMPGKRWTQEEDDLIRRKYPIVGSKIDELTNNGRSSRAIWLHAMYLGLSAPEKPTRKPIGERFWKRVMKTDGCWIWLGANTGKYGVIGTGGDGVQDYVHRVSWRMHFGEIPNGLFVLHKCDNRLCVNPSHLFLGTHQDNMDDMKSKGRQRVVGLGWRERGKKKLTLEIVTEIRELYKTGKFSYPELSRRFGTSERNVARIVRRERWNR